MKNRLLLPDPPCSGGLRPPFGGCRPVGTDSRRQRPPSSEDWTALRAGIHGGDGAPPSKSIRLGGTPAVSSDSRGAAVSVNDTATASPEACDAIARQRPSFPEGRDGARAVRLPISDFRASYLLSPAAKRPSPLSAIRHQSSVLGREAASPISCCGAAVRPSQRIAEATRRATRSTRHQPRATRYCCLAATSHTPHIVHRSFRLCPSHFYFCLLTSVQF